MKVYEMNGYRAPHLISSLEGYGGQLQILDVTAPGQLTIQITTHVVLSCWAFILFTVAFMENSRTEARNFVDQV
jgi:hypothetical protein